MKNFIKQNWFKLSVVTILLLIVWVLYQSLIVIPKNNMKSITDEIQNKKQIQINNLNMCFDEAELKKNNSIKYWGEQNDKICVESSLGTTSLMNRCLDSILSEMNKAKLQKEKDREECIRIYPQN